MTAEVACYYGRVRIVGSLQMTAEATFYLVSLAVLAKYEDKSEERK